MAEKLKASSILLRWSEYVPSSGVQDPLGLGLRGSTRLASRLLFCITSITPRARYFSFIPWCVQDWQSHERGKAFALGLREAIALREKALTLGCVAHHEGKACTGGALVGSDNVVKWFRQGRSTIDLRKLPFAKNPALDAYFNSIVNLGFFMTDGDLPDSDEQQDEDTELTFDDLKLSELGRQLADGYGSQIANLQSVRSLSSAKRVCTVSNLSELGKRGGLCELADQEAKDRQLLRDIFFARIKLRGESHLVRNRSLCLILDLCRQLNAKNYVLDETAFSSAVYFGEATSEEEERILFKIPKPLNDIANRWRMFYFHHYMSVALEGLFSWLVTHLSEKGIAGTSVKDLSETLNSKVISKYLTELLSISIPAKFGELTPSDLFSTVVRGFKELDSKTSRTIDQHLRPAHRLSEIQLEDEIRSQTHLRSPNGLAVPMVLLVLTLVRYFQWEGTNYGNWMATVSSDPYLDLVPPALINGLNRQFGRWWTRNWKDLAEFVVGRYVVQQHQSMSYEKTAKGDRCLLQVDGAKITIRPNDVYEKIGLGNPRFRSALRILIDLGLLAKDDDMITLTKDGKTFLREELAKGGNA